MLSFNAFLTESMSESDLLGVSKTLHDFLFHLNGPSDPAGKSKKQWEAEQQYKHDIEPIHEFSELKQLSIEDLQGGVIAPIPGDRTLTDFGIKAVNDVPL